MRSDTIRSPPQIRARNAATAAMLLTMLGQLPGATFASAFLPRPITSGARTNDHQVNTALPARIQRRRLAFQIHQSETGSSGERAQEPCVMNRLDLHDQFGRWRFLQSLLEAEIKSSDANEVLYRVLSSFLHSPRPSHIIDAEGKRRSNTSPTITDERRVIIESLLELDYGNGKNDVVGTVPALAEPECSINRQDVVDGLIQLLPDLREEEDAHKTGWDLVLEMYGREATKAEETNGSEEWNARCSIARLLIHYDFLTDYDF